MGCGCLLHRHFSVFDDDGVFVTRPEITVGGDLALYQHRVAHLGREVGGNGQVIAAFLTGAVADVAGGSRTTSCRTRSTS